MTASATEADQLFRQAMETYQAAIYAGVKMQEESVRRCAEILRTFAAPGGWPSVSAAMVQETIAAMQHNVDESTRLMNQNSQAAMDLVQNAFKACNCWPGESGEKTRADFWTTALGALRTNTQAILQANARALEAWDRLREDVTAKTSPPEHTAS
jgi:hypothetical protein